MTHPRTLAAASMAALFILGACNSEPEQVGGPIDPQADALKNAPPVQLPPQIKLAKSFRCKDNSLVHISFMNDDVTVVIRGKAEEPPVATLRAPAPGQPFVAEGYSLSGDGNSVTYKSPNSPNQTCRG